MRASPFNMGNDKKDSISDMMKLVKRVAHVNRNKKDGLAHTQYSLPVLQQHSPSKRIVLQKQLSKSSSQEGDLNQQQDQDDHVTKLKRGHIDRQYYASFSAIRKSKSPSATSQILSVASNQMELLSDENVELFKAKTPTT